MFRFCWVAHFTWSTWSAAVTTLLLFSAGDIASQELCDISQECNSTMSSGVLTPPSSPNSKPSSHCVTARPDESVQFELRPDAVALLANDTLVVRAGDRTLRELSSEEALERLEVLSGDPGERLCLEYTGSDPKSFFHVPFRKIARKTIRVQDPKQDIQQDYEPNTLVTWLFENTANNSLLHLVVRGARLEALQGEFLIIGSGDASELLESSRAAVLTRSVDPGTQLQFRVNGPDAYVILFMGDRPGKEGPRATEDKSLYLEWSRTDIGGEQKEPRPLNNISEKSKSLWKEAVLLCVDVHSTDDSVWKATKAAIQQTFAEAANNYVKHLPNVPDQKIEPHQVRLPDVSVVQGNNSWSFRVRVLVSVTSSEDPESALLNNQDLQAVFGTITNGLGHVRLNSSAAHSFWLTDQCKEAGDSVWWYLFAALSLAVSVALFLLIWRWRTLHYAQGPRSASKMCGKNKASATSLPMPDTFHTNPAYEPSDDESPRFHNLEQLNEESESRVVVEPRPGEREAENMLNNGEPSSRRTQHERFDSRALQPL
ncbi:uncharacterized protein LOC8043048 isoform X1 [Ixodes scapularis]|uniref:uncharacterized protein LOC8043048 isoform X1 n=2 Tax=Ixodes scapularis TaxID=6945 RepID=UPI001C3855C2|nr:uncharacterized protein LOC8043048 isoform X1 [Ixodes scapularis]